MGILCSKNSVNCFIYIQVVWNLFDLDSGSSGVSLSSFLFKTSMHFFSLLEVYGFFNFSCQLWLEGMEGGEEPSPLLSCISHSRLGSLVITKSLVRASRPAAVCSSFVFLCVPLPALPPPPPPP